ncbi:MAG: type IV pili methyl-accepting chemotaxis transducer N-terminal domain-containing protein [Geminicoccales bacterium]
MNKLLALGVLTAFATMPGSMAVAQNHEGVTAAEAAQRINIAGRQRMLSQRMAKAACLMATDISFAAAYDQLTQAYGLFERSEAALRIGDEVMGMHPETSAKVLDALAAVSQPWADYKVVIEKGIDGGTIENADLDSLDSASLDVLKYMNIAVFKTVRDYAAITEDVPLGLTITVDIAGRQRMLTQKAIKEACLMTVAADPTVHAERLAESIELFDQSLKALRDGYEDVGVMAAPTREIDRKLLEVESLWQPVKRTLDRAANGEVLSKRDISRVSRMSEPLLQTMNEAVGLYES